MGDTRLPFENYNPSTQKFSDLPILERLDLLLAGLSSPAYVNKEVAIEEMAFMLFMSDFHESNRKDELLSETKSFADQLYKDGFLTYCDGKYKVTLKLRIAHQEESFTYAGQAFRKSIELRRDQLLEQSNKDAQESQRVLAERQTEIQASIKYLTIWIALGSIATALVYFGQTLDYFEDHSFDVERLCYFLLGGASLYLLRETFRIYKSHKTKAGKNLNTL